MFSPSPHPSSVVVVVLMGRVFRALRLYERYPFHWSPNIYFDICTLRIEMITNAHVKFGTENYMGLLVCFSHHCWSTLEWTNIRLCVV